MDGRPRAVARLADGLDGVLGYADFIILPKDFAFAVHRGPEVGRECIDAGNPDAVQTAGNFITAFVELTARVEYRHDDFQRRAFFFGHDARGNATPVILYRYGIIFVNNDLDGVAVPGHSLVDGVIDDLPNEVVETLGGGVANVHRGAHPNGFEALQNLDVVGPVIGRREGDFYFFKNVVGHSE